MNELQNELQSFRFSTKIPIRWRDLDPLNHLNNAVYLTFYEHARMLYMHEGLKWDWQTHGLILAHATIDYKVPVLLTDMHTQIYVKCSQLGNKSIVNQYIMTIERDNTQLVASTAKTVLVCFDFVTNKSVIIPTEVKLKIEHYEKTIF